jgi:hypothetical protein
MGATGGAKDTTACADIGRASRLEVSKLRLKVKIWARTLTGPEGVKEKRKTKKAKNVPDERQK